MLLLLLRMPRFPYTTLFRSPQLEHAHGNACALETLFATVEEVEEARREARGLLGHTDAAWWRQLLHPGGEPDDVPLRGVDRKSTRLNSSHANMSYAVFCLKN